MTLDKFDADELYPDWELEARDDQEECGACGKSATGVDHNEPVCNKHRAGDVYGVSISDLL